MSSSKPCLAPHTISHLPPTKAGAPHVGLHNLALSGHPGLNCCRPPSDWEQKESSQSPLGSSNLPKQNSLCIHCPLFPEICFCPFYLVKIYSALRFWHKRDFLKEGFPDTALLLAPFLVPLLHISPMSWL